MNTRRKLIWVGDAVVASGFARVTHYVLDAFEKADWDIYVLGLNYLGDPHGYNYPIYPAFAGGDGFGVERIAELASKVKPDVIIIQNDPWNIKAYLKKIPGIPVVAIMPVDGKNCMAGKDLNGIKHAIFWTQFGANEAMKGGYNGSYSVIPLGVDLNIYVSGDKKLARKLAGLPDRIEDAFIVGNVNRNQPRKRLDLAIEYFAEWIHRYNVRDAYLFLHVAPTGDKGFDCSQLALYYGIANRLILAEPEIGFGIKEAALSNTYRCFDVQLSTTQGEGWGLTTLEGMACGIPQIAPKWSALGEWADGYASLVDCYYTAVTPNKINIIGGIPDKDKTIDALNELYSSEESRKSYQRLGLQLVEEDCYRWDNIGRKYVNEITEALLPEFINKEEVVAG